MLFDLQSPRRRRVLKVVYGTLAALFLIGFVGFGIGTETGGGGILDSITGGGGGDDNAYEDDIEAAQEKLQQNPKDTATLASLVELHYRAGSNQIDVDEETGQQSLTSEGEEQLNLGADAWAKYVKLAGGKVQTGAALLAFQTFSILGDTSLNRALEETSQTEALNEATQATSAYRDAAEAERILATDRPTVQAYSNLAFFLYRAGDIAGGDAATQEAVQLAKGPEAEQVQTELDQAKQQGEQLAQAIAQLQKSQQAGSATGGGENPLSGIGETGLGGGGLSAGGALGGQ
jgi:hypothetical protein